MKPGQMSNVSNPELTESSAIANAHAVGMGSNQDPMTTQTANRNPNRLRPAYAGSSTGKAEMNPDGTMAGQTSDQSSSAINVNAMRKKIFG